MYWLLSYEEQEKTRETILKLNREISEIHKRSQQDQTFPFIGRKDRTIAEKIIKSLSPEHGIICDPFAGSGTFIYAALDADRNASGNEWEPYAYEMASTVFKEQMSDVEYQEARRTLIEKVLPVMSQIYETRCPSCGHKIMFDGLFYDRKPEEYFHPKKHERMGKNGENIIFRGKYKCPKCGCKMKHYDNYDEEVRLRLESFHVDFPNPELIENSRLNFTAPEFIHYSALFSIRQQIALMTMYNAINELKEPEKSFFHDTLVSIVHLGKYTDYRSKSQDNHCPENRIKETNLYHRFLEKLDEWRSYILSFQKNHDYRNTTFSCLDFRKYLLSIPNNSIDLVLTDPPFGDTAQYFEHAQRVHPFIPYSLINDTDRMQKEVVISNAPSRKDKHGAAQFHKDIETLFREGSRVIKTHGFFVLYFRPKQSSWISDLNRLKHYGRKYGMEPLMSISLEIDDPSMRALASAAWTFSKDTCFVFLKLSSSERRWYEGDVDVDELVYLAAKKAATDKVEPFSIGKFNSEFLIQLRSSGLLKLSSSVYRDKIEKTLSRFTIRNGAQYILQSAPPYEFINREEDAEIRLREYAPVVLESLGERGKGFSFEDYVLQLSTYLENGSREIISRLKSVNPLISEIAEKMTEKRTDKETGKERLYLKPYEAPEEKDGKISLYKMDPYDFEQLIADYFKKRGYISTERIGGSGDRGVDVLATNKDGELELVQCKRYRKGSNVGSTAIQRVDSYMRTRHAVKGWVITTSDFTQDGKDEANLTGIITINGDDLIKSLNLYYPDKYCL